MKGGTAAAGDGPEGVTPKHGHPDAKMLRFPDSKVRRKKYRIKYPALTSYSRTPVDR